MSTPDPSEHTDIFAYPSPAFALRQRLCYYFIDVLMMSTAQQLYLSFAYHILVYGNSKKHSVHSATPAVLQTFQTANNDYTQLMISSLTAEPTTIHLRKHHQHAASTRDAYLTQSSATYLALKNHVAAQLCVPVDTIFVHKTPHGKPSLHWNPDQPHPIPGFHISLSHCPQLSAWTVQSQPCAVDLEATTPRRQQPALMQRLLQAIARHPSTPAASPDQYYQSWQRLHTVAQRLVFYHLWTYAECWCKWHGHTLWQTLHNGLPFPWPNISALQQTVHSTPLLTTTGSAHVTFYHPTAQHVLCCISLHTHTHLQLS